MNINRFLDEDLLGERKALAETQKQLQVLAKRLESGFVIGNKEQIVQALERMSENLGRYRTVVGELATLVPALDVEAYLREEFHRDFTAACGERGLRVQGDYPEYEVFPLKIRVFPERQAVTVQEKTLRGVRASFVADEVYTQLKKLHASAFNAGRFLTGLARAYDLLSARHAFEKGIRVASPDLSLIEVYELLTLLPQHRRQYSRQMFAFDLHRLLKSGQFEAPDGRRLWLGNVRENRRAIVVMDEEGREQRFGVIKFYREG